MEELGWGCLHVLPVAAWKRFKAFVLESSAEEWTESPGTSATAARGQIQSSKQLRVGKATSQKVLGVKTPYSSYLFPTQHPSKVATTRGCMKTAILTSPPHVDSEETGTWKDLACSTGTDHPV